MAFIYINNTENIQLKENDIWGITTNNRFLKSLVKRNAFSASLCSTLSSPRFARNMDLVMLQTMSSGIFWIWLHFHVNIMVLSTYIAVIPDVWKILDLQINLNSMLQQGLCFGLLRLKHSVSSTAVQIKAEI